MKAIITQISELAPDLTVSVTYDIYDGDKAVCKSQSATDTPSNIRATIKSKVEAYEAEYVAAQSVEVGEEI